MASSRGKDTEALLRKIEQQGCTVRRTNGGHWQVRTPTGVVLHHSYSPSDWRGFRNFRARLRRAGVKV